MESKQEQLLEKTTPSAALNSSYTFLKQALDAIIDLEEREKQLKNFLENNKISPLSQSNSSGISFFYFYSTIICLSPEIKNRVLQTIFVSDKDFSCLEGSIINRYLQSQEDWIIELYTTFLRDVMISGVISLCDLAQSGPENNPLYGSLLKTTVFESYQNHFYTSERRQWLIEHMILLKLKVPFRKGLFENLSPDVTKKLILDNLDYWSANRDFIIDGIEKRQITDFYIFQALVTPAEFSKLKSFRIPEDQYQLFQEFYSLPIKNNTLKANPAFFAQPTPHDSPARQNDHEIVPHNRRK